MLVPTEYVEQVKVAKLGDKQQQALDILKRLYEEHRQNLIADGLDPDTAKVTRQNWLDQIKEIEVNKSNRNRLVDRLNDKHLVVFDDILFN